MKRALVAGLPPALLGLVLVLWRRRETPPSTQEPSRFSGLPVLLIPTVIIAMPLLISGLRDAHGGSLLARTGPAIFVTGVMFTMFLLIALGRSFFAKERDPKPSRALLLIALIFAAAVDALGAFGIAEHQHAMQPVVDRLAWHPAAVNGNVIVVNVSTDVRGSAVELRAGLSGPSLTPAAEEQLAELDGQKPSTLVRSGEAVGNHPSRLQQTGAQGWQLGFVLPDAAIAQEIFGKMRANDVGAVPLDSEAAFDIFNVTAADGHDYRGQIEASRVISSGDPNWVSISRQRFSAGD